MSREEIYILYEAFLNPNLKNKHEFAEKIKEKYQIKDIHEKITIRKALDFVKDVWNIDFFFYDKFTRYARKFDLLDAEDKQQRNWKLQISYFNIFKLMMTPIYELFLLQMSKD